MQNLVFALSVICVLVIATLVLPPTADGKPGVPLPLGVIGHEGSTLLVVLNGIRLLIVTDEKLGLVRPKAVKKAA
jgi:Cd2+/Zn2+-exporting ATPase